LIVINQFDLVGSRESDIYSLNVMENTNKLPGMVAVLNEPSSSFAQLLQSIVPENCQPNLVWCCIPIHYPWELVSLPWIGT